jgi:hypothetical protein
MIAQTVPAWLRLLALDGALATGEPRTLRNRVLHAAAQLIRGGRRRRWKIAADWPEETCCSRWAASPAG